MEDSGVTLGTATDDQNNPSAATYEMTATAAAAASARAVVGGADGGAGLPSAHALLSHDPHKREPNYEDYEMEDAQDVSSSDRSISANTTRKRKSSTYGSVSGYDEDYTETHSSRSGTDKKQNHSEIEKRRRDKMNTYITELSAMIPMCSAMARKLDKLTVLRMAVQHLRSVRGTLSACPLAARPRPPFVSERELNQLILQAAGDSFLLVVSCDRGRLLYVSHSVNALLQYDQTELLGQSIFDILHPKDVTKMKEQLSSSDLSPRERLIDAKTMLPVKSDVMASGQRLCPGARRSFFCRIKCKQSTEPPAPAPAPLKEEDNLTTKHKKKTDKKYCVVQCTGYLKSWAPAEVAGSAPEGDDDHCTMSCLVAIGRAMPSAPRSPASASAPAPAPVPAPATRPLRTMQYVSRHAIDGKFLFVDQRVTLALGFLPQEMLGTSLYEYVSGTALGALARTHKQALVRRDALRTPPYQFRRKDGSFVTIQTHFKPFRNPWTKDVDSLVANNSIVTDVLASDSGTQTYEAFKQTAPEAEAGEDMQRVIESHMGAHKIGAAIAEEALRRPPSSSPHDPMLLHDPLFSSSTIVDNILGVELNNYARSTGAGAPASAPHAASPPLPSLGVSLDGNGEAAMAVIMSLLEADAGLGGPVNFSGLPWPLP